MVFGCNLCLSFSSRSESRVRIKRIKLAFLIVVAVVAAGMAIVWTGNHLATPDSRALIIKQQYYYNKYFVGIECIERNKLGR